MLVFDQIMKFPGSNTPTLSAYGCRSEENWSKAAARMQALLPCMPINADALEVA